VSDHVGKQEDGHGTKDAGETDSGWEDHEFALGRLPATGAVRGETLQDEARRNRRYSRRGACVDTTETGKRGCHPPVGRKGQRAVPAGSGFQIGSLLGETKPNVGRGRNWKSAFFHRKTNISVCISLGDETWFLRNEAK
jgi:hypothetical protein